MTDLLPVRRVRRARVTLAGTVLLAAALWGGALAAGIVAALAAVAIVEPTTAAFLAPSTRLLAGAAAIVAVTTVLWRARAVWSIARVALWIEERAPHLEYALVTVVGFRYSDGPAAVYAAGAPAPALIEAADRADVEAIVRRSAGRTLAWAAVAVLVAGVTVRLLHATDRLDAMGNGRARRAAVAPLGNRLAKLRAEVVPPAYSRLPRRTIGDPTNVAALYGSEIRFIGHGPPDGVTAVVDRDTIVKDTLAAKAAGGGWVVRLPMPRLAGLIRLRDRAYHRSVVLEPQADSAPHVLLRSPARDTTWRWDHPPRGTLALEADIDDDYGIRSAFFEILVSTGGEESFDTKDKSTARVDLGNQKRATLRATLNYAALGVAPGTVLHIRAVAYDNNDVADSAGKGISETRTLRVATKEESDTSNVQAADPLPIDSLWMGQRVLNARTDTLIRFRQPKITHDQYVDTSTGYSDRQQLIRDRVEEIIILLEDDGVGGRVETESSRLLRQASEQMWQARQYLGIGQPDSAYVPPKSYMKEALRLLEAARKAQKYYLRGVLQARPVDIAAARLKGTDEGHAADRTGRAISDDVRRTLRSRLAAVAAFAVGEPRDAVDSLMAVRAVALRGAPAVAAALQAAIDSARSGRAMAIPLMHARRLLDPPPQVTAGPPAWGGGWVP